MPSTGFISFIIDDGMILVSKKLHGPDAAMQLLLGGSGFLPELPLDRRLKTNGFVEHVAAAGHMRCAES